jgi:hypothetical protein
VVIVTGSMLFFLLQFPLANLGLCVLFARTAPTRKPLVAQLAAEVVALRQPSSHHPGLHRFFQGATWLWAGIFFVTTVGLAVLMYTETVKVFLLLTTAVTIGGVGGLVRSRAAPLRPPRPLRPVLKPGVTTTMEHCRGQNHYDAPSSWSAGLAAGSRNAIRCITGTTRREPRVLRGVRARGWRGVPGRVPRRAPR